MTNTPLVPVFTGTIQNQSIQLCNARDLHHFLESQQDFSNWIKNRIKQYGFIEGEDYSINLSNRSDGKPGKGCTEYHLTLDMAKELAMVENNDKGRQIRRYFIALERSGIATPIQAFETLQSTDMNNISRVVWMIASRQASRESWVQAVWYRLRQETNCPSPHKFRVNHLPIIVNELLRIYAYSKELSRIHCEAEKQIIKRVLRGNENAAQVLDEIEQSFKKLTADDGLELKRHFSQWEELEIGVLSDRKNHNNGNPAYLDEFREPLESR